jgi:class I fructose-bisphosphate aldolase
MESSAVNTILSHYQSDSPGVKGNLYRILMHGRLGGTGRMIILPVDQGFEHGPARSFSPNPAAYDPLYHFQLATEAGMNAFAAPLGMLEAGADIFAGRIPTILKMNSANSLSPSDSPKDQAVTACVNDALRLGCSAVGFTIYPSSSAAQNMMEEIKEIACEAKSKGIAVVIWSYPRGEALTKKGETALDVTAYAAQIAALLGAHIIKVKIPDEHIETPECQKIYSTYSIPMATKIERIRHVMQAAFNGRRIVVFSGGAKKDTDSLLEDARAIHLGGGHGSIVGRNMFQRRPEEALALLTEMVDIYSGSMYPE